jgi:hypothetical protein
VTLRGRRILLATLAIGLAGGVFGEQALAVELPPPLPAPEPAPISVPTVVAADAPAVPSPASVAEAPAPQEAVAVAERAAQDVVEAAAAAPLPSVEPVETVPALAEQAAPAPPAGRETVESSAAARRPEPSTRRKPRPARPARQTAAGGDASRTVSRSMRAVERTKSLLPREAGAAASRLPQPVPSGATGTALLQGASGGGPGLLSAAALAMPFGVPPDLGTRLIPVSTLVRRTLVTSRLERPG